MGKAGASSQAEVERKFDVPSGTARPCFDAVAGVSGTSARPAVAMEAVYVDTACHDLAARRVTLRRRTGGADEGWHLKLPPAGDDEAGARTEMHAPLGADDGQVPAALFDTVLAIVRDRPLTPVARVSTVREVTVIHGDDGVALAEFCDDTVHAYRLDGGDGTPRTWREWELELLDPPGRPKDAARLLDRLSAPILDSGAVPAAHASKLAKTLGTRLMRFADEDAADPVHRAVGAQIERLLEADRGVRADAEDSVHQMRVATRQIRSLLQASEETFGLDDDAPILSELRELAAVLGIARDAEVLAERYRSALDALPAELVRGPVRERLVDGARRRYESGLRRSLAAMRSARYFRMLDTLEALLATGASAAERADTPHTTIGSSYRRVRKTVKAARRAARGAAETERDHALHRIRKAAKRLRYIAAATGEPRVEQRAKWIQTLLGEHQDAVVSREHLLAEADAAAAAGEDTFTYGLLYQREADLARHCRDQLDDALGALRRSVRRT